MENRYQWLSPGGRVCPGQRRRPSGRFENSTLLFNYSVSGTPGAGMFHHLPLTDNCENSFWNAGKARADLVMLYDEKNCRMA